MRRIKGLWAGWLTVLVTVLTASPLALAAAADTIIIGTTDKPALLEPAMAYELPGWWLISRTHDYLLNRDAHTEKLVSGLATRYEVSADGLTYTFHLRQDVSFTDGTPFNADAVKFTFERNLKLNGDPVFLIQGIQEVKVVDPSTVQIRLKERDATFLQKLSLTSPAAILSPKTYTAATVQETQKVTDLTGTIGTGPYYIAQFVPDQYVLLTAYPGYWGPAPKTKNILIKYYPDAPALALAMRSGEVDIAWRSLNPDDLTAFAKDRRFQVVKGVGGLSVRYLVFQNELPPFDNVNVRKGLALTIDRAEIVAKAFAGYNTPAYTLVPPGLPYSVNTFPKRDLTRAKALIQQAGYSAAKPLGINLWFDSSGHYSTTESDVAALIKKQMEATGLVEVTLQPLDWGTMTDKLDEASMGMFLLGWYPDYLDAENYTAPFLKSPDNDWLGSRYHDDEMQRLVTAASQATNDGERARLYRAVQERMAEQMPLVPLWFNTLENYAVAKPSIKGIYLPADLELRLAPLAKD